MLNDSFCRRRELNKLNLLVSKCPINDQISWQYFTVHLDKFKSLFELKSFPFYLKADA